MTIVIAANSLSLKNGVMKKLTDNNEQAQNEREESTYALLIRSEEKSRNLIEIIIYPLLVIGVLLAIWQFAVQPVTLPGTVL